MLTLLADSQCCAQLSPAPNCSCRPLVKRIASLFFEAVRGLWSRVREAQRRWTGLERGRARVSIRLRLWVPFAPYFFFSFESTPFLDTPGVLPHTATASGCADRIALQYFFPSDLTRSTPALSFSTRMLRAPPSPLPVTSRPVLSCTRIHEQPAESLALLVSFLKSGLTERQVVKYLSVFSCIGPVGEMT